MTAKNLLCIFSLLALTAALPCLTLAQEKEGKSEQRTSTASVRPVGERTSFTDTDASRKASSAEDVEQLKSKVEQLQALVEQQQRALAEMQRNIAALTSKTATPVPVAAPSTAADRTATPLPATATVQTNNSGSPASSAQEQPKTGEKSGLVAGWD